MVQMTGVLVLAIGLPQMFAFDRKRRARRQFVMVLGYRGHARRDGCSSGCARRGRTPARCRACFTYAAAISVRAGRMAAQIFLDLSIGMTFIVHRRPRAHRARGPVLAERRDGGTPWHPHHIAERNALFAIIALGEGVIGTVAALSAVVEQQGWTLDAALAASPARGSPSESGGSITCCPPRRCSMRTASDPSSGAMADGHRHGDRRDRCGIARRRALHRAQSTHRTACRPCVTAAIPVGIFLGSVYALYYYLVRQFDSLHLWLLSGSASRS
jgi:hypothetical protein